MPKDDCACRKRAEVMVVPCGDAETAILEELLGRLARSEAERVDWSDYDAEKVFEKVTDEWDEFREAFVRGQIEGRHGQIDELYDVMVTAFKGIRRLMG